MVIKKSSEIYLMIFIFLFISIIGIVDAIPTFIPAPSAKNLTEDILFTLYINASDNETDMNSTLVYGSIQYYNSTSEETSLFSIETISGGPAVGLINFTPVQADVGNYTVVFTVVNSNKDDAIKTVTYQIFEINDAPDLTGIPDQSIDEDENPTDNWIDLWNYASDEESADSKLTFYIQNQTNISFINCSVVSNRWINCTNPFSNWSGTSTVIVNVTDENSWDNDTFIITILPINDAPIFNASVMNVTWPEDIINNSINLTVSFYDIDSSISGYDYESVQNIGVLIDNTTGIVTLTPNSNFTGVRYTRFRAYDGNSWSGYSNNVTLNVTPVDDAPILHSILNITGVKDIILYYDVNATEVDNETIYFSSNSSLLVINLTTGIINFVPNESHIGSYWINISVNDSAGSWDSEIINFTVRNSTAPVLDAIVALNATEDSEFYYDANATDVDGDSIYFFDNSSLFEINISTGVINFTANNSQVGSYWINISVNDSYGLSDSEVINFTVLNTNDAPILDSSIPNQTWQEDSVLTGMDLSDYFSDPDGDNLTYTASAVDSITLSINSGTSVVTFTPAANFYGIRYVIFNASDGINTTQSNNITLNVTNVAETTTTVIVSGGGGGGGTKKMSINIYPKESLKITPNSEKTITFGINNTGEVDLSTFSIKVSSNIEGMLLSLSKDNFKKLKRKKPLETELTLLSKEIKPGTYELIFDTTSTTNKFSQRVTLYIDITGEEELTRMQFVKDMFKEHPQCLELNELVLEAERLLNADENAKANKLIETAIEGCKDLISVIEKKKKKFSILKNKKVLVRGGLMSVIMIIFLISAGYFFREFRSSKNVKPERWTFKAG